jgi:hypothetical protein
MRSRFRARRATLLIAKTSRHLQRVRDPDHQSVQRDTKQNLPPERFVHEALVDLGRRPVLDGQRDLFRENETVRERQQTVNDQESRAMFPPVLHTQTDPPRHGA